jgi:hypothetical protein
MPAITLADQADISHSQTCPARGHCSAIHADGDLGTGQDSPRVHAQADLAADQQSCLPTAYSEQWLEYLGRIERVAKHLGPQPNSIIGCRTSLQGASPAISFLSNPGGVRTMDASSSRQSDDSAEIEVSVTRRGFDAV